MGRAQKQKYMRKEKIQKLSCGEIEIAVANYFNPRIHLIVPNISYGMNLYECDLLVMNGRNYGVEVEIKISKADLKKDALKKHGHVSNKLRRLFFAIPEYLFTDEVVAMIPERAGILVISIRKKEGTHIFNPKCYMKRAAKINKFARPFSQGERVEMGRLGMLRYWNIRNNYNK